MIDLNDGDDLSCGCSGEKFAIAAVASHTRACQRRFASPSLSWPSSGFKQPFALMNAFPTMFEGVGVFVTVEAKRSGFSEGSGTGGW